MITGIIICHGQLAAELKNAVECILGPVESLLTFSNDKLSPRTLYDQIVQAMENQTDSPMIIMVDLRGGSCWSVAKLLTKEFPQMRILTGVNLPMLTAFLTKRRQNDLQTLAEIMENDAHRGILLENGL